MRGDYTEPKTPISTVVVVVAAAVTIAAMLVLFWSVFLATIWLFGSSVLQPLVDTDVQAIQAWFAALVPT